MKENTLIKNDKTEDIQMVTDFKDELERIKQKLAKDFSKYSELEKMKNKQKLTGRAVIFRKIENTNNPKEINDINNNNDFFEKIPAKEDFNFKYNNLENTDKINSKSSDYINNYRTTNISSINTRNINPLNYNLSFRKKYIDISNEEPEEENDLNFSFTNDLNKQRNLSTDNKTKIINNNINININNNSSLILDSKLDQQIKFIDEKSENNRKEEEKTQQKIKQIENRLQ